MYVHGVSFSVWHMHTHSRHRVCSSKPSPLPPASLSPFLSPSSSPPSHSHLQPASTISSLHQKQWRRASHRGRGGGAADRIWSSSACGENDLEERQRERARAGTTQAGISSSFSRHRYLPWNEEGEIWVGGEGGKGMHRRANERRKKIERRETSAEDKKMYSGPLPWTLDYGSLLLLPSLPWTP